MIITIGLAGHEDRPGTSMGSEAGHAGGISRIIKWLTHD